MTVPDLEDRAAALLRNAKDVAKNRVEASFDVAEDLGETVTHVLETWHGDFLNRAADHPDELAVSVRARELWDKETA